MPGSKITRGPLKSRAARRTVGIPAEIIPALREHLAVFVATDPGALVFAPLRRSNFNKLSGWKHAVASVGLPAAHFHDLRHTGNTFAAASGVGIKDLMARMGHDSERAAMIYQHEARGADRAITGAIDAHVRAQRAHGGDDDGLVPVLGPQANGTLMARGLSSGPGRTLHGSQIIAVTWGLIVERATGIEPAWPAWKAATLPAWTCESPGPLMRVSHRSDRESPCWTLLSGT
jgi:Phage integrase family